MKKFLLSICLLFAFAVTAPAWSQTSILPARIAAKQSTNIRFATDSMGGLNSWSYPQVFAQTLTTKAPDATVIFKTRVYPGTGDGTVTSTTLQTGTGGYTLTVILDSLPGSTTYRADNPNLIWAPTDHIGVIQLGVNDAVNFGLNSTYTPSIYSANLRYLGKYAEENYGTQIVLVQPFWSDALATPRIEVAGAAWLTTRLGKLNNWLVVPWRTDVAEKHYTGTGQAGQDNWMINPGDDTHCGVPCNAAQAASIVKVLIP